MWLACGCAYRQSEAVRAASFSPYTQQRIGQEDIRAYLCSRVAFVTTSDENPTNKWATGDFRLPDVSNLGCAAMIDSRGYFLTAAHCLNHSFIYLIYDDLPVTRAMRARVVWQGDWRNGQPDLAILQVRRPLKLTFDWADEIHIDQLVIAVGMAWTNHPYRQPQRAQLMAGKILATNKLKAAEGFLRVANNLPLQPGDSGGPLVDEQGRLIGINVQGTPPSVHWILPKRVLPMVAERPNLNWLRAIIEKDAANHPIEAAGQSAN